MVASIAGKENTLRRREATPSVVVANGGTNVELKSEVEAERSELGDAATRWSAAARVGIEMSASLINGFANALSSAADGFRSDRDRTDRCRPHSDTLQPLPQAF
jgi:hypothetical protein